MKNILEVSLPLLAHFGENRPSRDFGSHSNIALYQRYNGALLYNV